MTKTKSTKRALLLSALSLLMCVSMLIGSTFAWFTDSVTSAGNKIVAGTLDVQLLMDADVDGTYDDISDSTSPIFGAGSIAQNNNAQTLWEPGKTQVAYLAIKNNGNLDLKYTVGLNVQNVSKDLYKVMEYAIVADANKAAPVTAWNGGNSVVVGTQSVSGDVSLAAGATHYFALAIHMDETAGNEYQGGEVNFDLTVLATQLTSESDSFDDQYDKDATYPAVGTVTVPENNAADVVISSDSIEVAIPAAAAGAGDVYKVEVSNKTIETDDTTSETTVAFDLTLYKNNVKVSDDTTIYKVKQNIGAGLFISEVTHNGTALNKDITGAGGVDQTWTYDAVTGDLTIYTASFSPFTVTYTNYKDYTKKLNAGHNVNSTISVSTGADFLPIVAVNPEIYGYSVFDGDTRIANYVHFRISDVKKETIDENSYKVSLNLAVKDENGNDLELKSGSPYNTGKEYLHVYMNLIEVPAGYSISTVKVKGSTFTLTNNASGNPATGEYWIGYEAKDVYLQSMVAGTIEIILTK